MGRLNPSTYSTFLVLIGLCVLVGSIVVWWLRRDLKEETPVSDDDVLRDLERAFFAGQMDKAEYERVTASIKGMRGGVPRPTPVEEPQPEPPAASESGAEGDDNPPKVALPS